MIMRILLIEDDPLIGKATRRALTAENYSVDWIDNGSHALTAIKTHDYHAIVLDLGLPDMDGQELLQRFRRQGVNCPILIITARDAVSDRILNLDNGADDFLVKPFDLDELAARLRVSIRRTQGRAEEQIQVGAITLTPSRKAVTLDGQSVSVTGREFAVLHALMGAKGQVLNRDQLEQTIYGWGEEVESNSLEVHIHHLRRKLGKGSIETIHGLGYRIGRVESLQNAH